MHDELEDGPVARLMALVTALVAGAAWFGILSVGVGYLAMRSGSILRVLMVDGLSYGVGGLVGAVWVATMLAAAVKTGAAAATGTPEDPNEVLRTSKQLSGCLLALPMVSVGAFMTALGIPPPGDRPGR